MLSARADIGMLSLLNFQKIIDLFNPIDRACQLGGMVFGIFGVDRSRQGHLAFKSIHRNSKTAQLGIVEKLGFHFGGYGCVVDDIAGCSPGRCLIVPLAIVAVSFVWPCGVEAATRDRTRPGSRPDRHPADCVTGPWGSPAGGRGTAEKCPSSRWHHHSRRPCGRTFHP